MAARSARETLRQATASTSEGDECQAVREVDERPRRCLFARTAGLRDCGGVEVLAVGCCAFGIQNMPAGALRTWASCQGLSVLPYLVVGASYGMQLAYRVHPTRLLAASRL
jgi:hypothetical protein